MKSLHRQMTLLVLPCIPLILSNATPSRAGQVAIQEEQEKLDAQSKKIEGLIEQLGHGNFQQRQAAGKLLIQIGEKALPYLSAAETEKDPEIAFRAKSIVSAILKNARTSSSIGMEFSMIDVGEFTMGSPDNERGRHEKSEMAHEVRLTKFYLLGKKEVTQKEFASIMGFQPSWFSATGKGADKVKKFETDTFPVDSASWYDAVMFCNKLSEKDNLPRHYTLTEIKKEGNSIISAKVKVNGGSGYRLPTEAEWEYACRAGTSTPYHFGKSGRGGNFQFVQSGGYGTSRTYALGRTTTVGSYKPNAWGLYDMHGNVAEWCHDWYSQSYYAYSPGTDPPGPKSGVLSYKVLRGGSFLVKHTSCRSATRYYAVPRTVNYFAGFRVARDLSQYMNEAMKARKQ